VSGTGFVLSFIVPFMYDKNKAFYDQKIAMLNRDKIEDKIEAFCDHQNRIAQRQDNLVAVLEVLEVRVLRRPSEMLN
jgi:hypothetical protein